MTVEEATPMGSLLEELETRAAAARERMDDIEAQLAEVNGGLEEARENLARLRTIRQPLPAVREERRERIRLLDGAAPESARRSSVRQRHPSPKGGSG
ncbi:hypothetical protein [Streptomyces sp. AcE210]|uniref:hypothetical protein n=1 Tax=Streptomyces sp. AcE210 TaxID=2292703 RepID=UPI0010584CF8|nr:hypothetical protein [Streptomyces sp. AcE210]